MRIPRLVTLLALWTSLFPVFESLAQIEILLPFDGSLCEADDEVFGLDTYATAVSADGEVFVGFAYKGISLVPGAGGGNGPNPGPGCVYDEIIAFKWENGTMTELPFYYNPSSFLSFDQRVLGISADGKRIFGYTSFEAFYHNAGPPQVLENGTLSAGSFGESVPFRAGMQAQKNPVDGWYGELSSGGRSVEAVSADASTFVGQGTSGQATVWTEDSATVISPLGGFTRGIATGVSGDGSVVCGYFYSHSTDDDGYIGDAGFVWTEVGGTQLIRDLVRNQGYPFDDNQPDIMPTAISEDGTTVVGAVDGTGDDAARWFPFRLKLEPFVALRMNVPSEMPMLGDVVPVEVVVLSTFDENVSVTFPETLLRTMQTEILEFEEMEIEDFVLTKASPKKSFTVEVEIKDSGVGELTSEIEYTVKGKKSTLNVSEKILIESLTIKLNALPLIGGKPIVNFILDEDNKPTDENGNPVTPKIEVVIENLSEQPVTAFLQGLDPRKRDDSAVLGRIETLGKFPMELGQIVKGTPKKQEIELKLNEDGRFEFSALVTGHFEDPTDHFTVSKKGAPIAVGEPYPVEIEIEFDRSTSNITNQNNGAFFLVPGGDLKVIASVNNLTTNSTLMFSGIKAKKTLNAFQAQLTSDDGNAVDPPFVHDHEVDANASAILSGIIKTDPNGAPSGTVTWFLPEGAILKDDKTGEETELTEDDFLVTSTVGGWLGDDLTTRVIQDNSREPKVVLSALETAAYFSKASLVAVGDWMNDNIDLIGGIGRVAGTISADPSILADYVGEGSRAVWEAAEMVHLGWSSMSPGQKDAFILQATDEVYRRAQFLATAPFDKEKRDEALAFTRNATYALFGGVEDAYASDDPARIAELWGTVSGNVAAEVVSSLIPSPKFTRYFNGAELASLSKSADNIRSLNAQQRILRDVPVGPIGRRLAIDGWGIGGKHLDDVQEVLGRLKMKGYARERAPRSITLSEVLDEAVLKPQAMKPKGFSDLDRLMLGNDVPTLKGKNGADLDLDAITVVMWPPENSLISARLKAAGESEETIKAVLARADSRRKEYSKRFPEFKQYKEDGIPVEFDYKSNDSAPINPNNASGATKAFDYETIETSSGALIHVPKMGNANNELRYITGDVDWIHFSWLDGTPLDSKTASNLYEVLEVCCGLQHGETVTWMNKGQAVFEGKASQIGEYIVGANPGDQAKALLEVTGESIRAVRIRPKLTRFAQDTRNHLIFFDGGTKSLQKALKAADLENAFAILFNNLPARKVVLPFMWFARGANFGDDTTVDGQEWTYSDDPDAVMARQTDDGSLERFDGKNWIPWDPKTNPTPQSTKGSRLRISSLGTETAKPSEEGDLNMTPTTVLETAVDAGSTVLPFVDLALLWADELEGHLESWFKVGDVIAIAPGTDLQEIRKVVSLSPLTIDQPIDNSHGEDTIVAVVPESLLLSIDPIDTVNRSSDKPIVFAGTVAYGFDLPLDSQVIFEISSDLKEWDTITAEALVGGELLNGAVKLDYPGEPIFVILDLNGQKQFLRWRNQ